MDGGRQACVIRPELVGRVITARRSRFGNATGFVTDFSAIDS